MDKDKSNLQSRNINWLFSQNCNFIMGATHNSNLPEMILPEVAFVGRSNVGKSSLINSLLNRSNLARVSNTPGRTQQINFFNLAELLMLVDLPGYGYAQAPKKQVKNWTRMVNDYLKGRAILKRVCLLIDSRHGLKEVDLNVMKMLDEAAVNYQIILTKIDKISRTELDKVKAEITAKAEIHTAMHPDIIITSSKDRLGLIDLQTELANFVSLEIKPNAEL